MATKSANPSADADTTEEETTAPQPSSFETIYLFAAVVFLILAIVIVLLAAGQKYNVGPFGK